MSLSSFPTLKRQRASPPPSPTSSSSPKRAVSEDGFQSSSDSGRFEGSAMLTPNMQGGIQGSSPLRQGSTEPDAEADVGETWVQRTENVHLNSEGMDPDGQDDVSAEDIKGQYSELLACLPPPFETWEKYYLVPATFLEDLKVLALESSSFTKATASASDLRVDLTSLLKHDASRTVFAIDTIKVQDGKRALAPRGTQKELWEVKDGLLENEDFQFVSADGWRKLLQWYGPYDGPSLGRFGIPGERVQMVPPVFTLYLVDRTTNAADPPSAVDLAAPRDADTEPIALTCPSETPLTTFTGFLTSLVQARLPDGHSQYLRFWLIDTISPQADASTLPALQSLHLPATLLPSLSGRLLPSPDSSQNLTCSQAGLENGDVIAVEIGKRSPFGLVAWSVDVNEQGKAMEKTGSTIPVPSAPAPLFSKPAFFGGSGTTKNADASSSKSSESGVQTRSQSRKGGRQGKGLVGLVNLGNTCFMNSAVQCLSNTRELNDYFVSGVYKDELNPDNPLGMGGQIAEAFGSVMENLWTKSTPHSSISPRQLKWTTSRFAPQFAGYGQHDTQEFIAFLLDGLHEDLNRIKKKPYIEKPDWKPGGGDKELAALGKECWEGYKKRNDSVIVDLFQGQLQSTLVCPECRKESITLDPFMYLTVPLPVAQYRTLKLLYVSSDTEKPPIRFRLLIPQNASFGNVKERLSQLTKVNPRHIVGYDQWKGMPYSWFSDSDHNAECKDADIPVFHELEVSVSSTRKSTGTSASETTVTLPVYTFLTVEDSRSRYRNDLPADCAEVPFFITLSKAEASDPSAIRKAITDGYTRFVRDEARPRMWVSSTSAKAAVPQHAHEEHDSVTEIHLDGDQTRIVEVSPFQDDVSNNGTDSGSMLSIEKTHGSTASLSTLGSSKSGTSRLVPRGDLFKVHVADASAADSASSISVFKSKDPTIPFFKGTPQSASSSWSLLENRKKPKKNLFGQVTSGFRSIVGGHTSEDENSPANSAVLPPPVVRPGEGIFCEWSAKTFDEYFDLTIDYEVHDDPGIEAQVAKKKEGKAISIEDCLDEFSKEETLGQDDLWFCPQCKKHQAATKRLEIYQAPDILVICIKRFGSSRRLSDKLDNLVHFPIDGLDMEDRIGERRVAQSLRLSPEQMVEYGMETVNEPMIYDLYAVDNHFGGMGGGHYTAFCRNREDGQWYNYDDSRVSRTSEESVQSRAAYLLFYRRRTARPIGGLSRVKAEEASRAASPMPPSPPLDPSRTSGLQGAESPTQDSSTSDSDDLPSYSAGPASPALPSPALSADAGSDFEDLTRTKPDLGGAIGSAIGFGNTAWSGSPTAQRGVHHSFGVRGDTSSPDVDVDTDVTLGDSGLPSPPASDHGFEFVQGSGNGEEDAVMVSPPRSDV